ncbi:hypothetical protein MVI01_14630 [Myxococcus virescens]|uniref:Uncharacterized protein n=1 Tax=Myxococcus virescens TaxID=83456 RepID=A0A511HAE6_9BACT|nr:hypothetical protein MVI01_14630 [Myxococcus virescens]
MFVGGFFGWVERAGAYPAYASDESGRHESLKGAARKPCLDEAGLDAEVREPCGAFAVSR